MIENTLNAPFRRIGIVGLGLMGGSLARSLKGLSDPPRVRAMSENRADLEEGVEVGVVDEAPADPRGFFSGLDLVVYCTPLQATLELLSSHRSQFHHDTLITDVVSLKAPILERVKRLNLDTAFVGSHPMAGGEGTGFGASREDLFAGSKIWIVADGPPPTVVDRVSRFWSRLGAQPRRIGAQEHDTLMAWISHLPQLSANALALALADAGIRREELGPGGKDMTRLAGSGAEMWQDLFEEAPGALPEAMEAMERALAEIGALIQDRKGEAVADLMRRTRRWFEGEGWS